MIEKKLRLINLFDFYGQLLTEKQQMILNYYLNDDYSLGEISEVVGISRQAVYDTFKRSEKSLENYETKLKLYERFEKHKLEIKHIIEEIEKPNRDMVYIIDKLYDIIEE